LRRKITKGMWEEIVIEEHHPVKVYCSPLIDEYHAHWGEVLQSSVFVHEHTYRWLPWM
jgi:hypothetical protein